MRVTVAAISARQPDWVGNAWQIYLKRLPRHWKTTLRELRPAQKSRSRSTATGVEDEGRRLLAPIEAGACVVALDERGDAWGSLDFSRQLAGWLAEYSEIVFVIGGADGLAKPVLDRANFCLSLSAMTLPHGLARIVLLEQLYRASTIHSGHPYHRE